MPIQAAIFDLDGTLVDSVDFHAEAWRLTFMRHARNIPFEDIRAQIGKGGDTLLPVFFSEEEIEQFGEKMKSQRDETFQEQFMSKVRPFPSVRALFERIKQDGLQIALASSAKQDELKHYEKLLDIADLVDAATTIDDVERSKPHPDIFAAALKKLGLPGGAALAVGDAPYDAEAAGKVGVKTIGMLCGGFPEERLRAAGVVAVFRDPAELLAEYGRSPFGSDL